MVLHQEHYSNDNLIHLNDYDQQISEYYQQRSQGKLSLSFSEHIIKTVVKEARPHMLPYLHTQGFSTR
jgi:nitroreductase